MNAQILIKKILELNQLRIEQEDEAKRRAEEDRIRGEQERELLRQLIRLTTDEGL